MSSQVLELPILETKITPTEGLFNLRLGEVWEYRELLYFLVWRDIKIRYKQAALGAAWAILQPVLTMVTFTLFFGRLAKVPSDGIPYPLFVFAALLPWQVFGYALTQSANSLVGNQNLIQKVYFPRLLIPMSAVFASLVDFVWAFVVFLGLMAYNHRMPTIHILYLPVFLLLAVTTALAVGLWLSALNVRFRDVRHTIPFLAQFWLVATPVAYSASLVPEQWRMLYGLNPMAGVVGGFRWALLGQAQNPGMLLWVSIGAVIALLIGGVIYFQRVEALFADIV